MSAAPTLRASTCWSSLASLLMAAARLVSGIWLARALPTADNGGVIFVLWIAATAALVAGMGLSGSLQRFLSEGQSWRSDDQSSRDFERIVGRWLLAALLVGAALVSVVTASMPTSIPGPCWLPAAVMLVLGLEGLGSAVLSGRQQFTRLARWSLVAAIAQLVGVALGIRSGGVLGGTLGYAMSSVPLALFGLRALAGRARQVDATRLRALVRFAISIWFTGLCAAFLWTRMELYVIAHVADAHALALYGVGLAWAALVSQPPLILLGALTPHFSAQIGRLEHASAFRTYRQATILLALVLIPICLGAAALTPLLLPLVYGPAYHDAVPAGMVLAAGGIWLTASVGSSLIYASASSRILVVTSIIGVVLASAVGLAVIPATGIIGAAWTRFCLQGVMVGIGFWCIRTLMGCPIPLRALGLVALAAMPCAAGLYACACLWGWRGAAPAAPAAILLYALLVRWLGVLAAEDKELVHSLVTGLISALGRPADPQAASVVGGTDLDGRR
jgi:O-antigen/teichoic acid export membrane protein